MNAPIRPLIALAGLAAVTISFATVRESRSLAESGDVKPFSLIETLLGESRRLFANHFFVKADAYFHSGYYPTVFDQTEGPRTLHIAEDAGAVEEKHTDSASGFLGQPLDLFEAFSRRFFPNEHTHLDEGGASTCTDPSHHHDHDHDHDHDGHPDHGDDAHGESGDGGDVREMLPWLKIATSLDPNNVETYTVTAFWLRTKLHRIPEAEQVIREGLRNNPRNPSLLFELGRIFFQDRKDLDRARNVFEAGIASWDKTESTKKEPNTFLALQLIAHLAELEEQAGNLDRSIQLWEHAKKFSPFPANAQRHIDDIRAKQAAPPAAQ